MNDIINIQHPSHIDTLCNLVSSGLGEVFMLVLVLGVFILAYLMIHKKNEYRVVLNANQTEKEFANTLFLLLSIDNNIDVVKAQFNGKKYVIKSTDSIGNIRKKYPNLGL